MYLCIFPAGPAAAHPRRRAVPLQLRRGGRGGGGGRPAQPDGLLLPGGGAGGTGADGHVGGGGAGGAGAGRGADQLPAGAAGVHRLQRVRLLPAGRLHQVSGTCWGPFINDVISEGGYSYFYEKLTS